MYKPIKENLKRLALPPWDGLDDNVKISLLLASSLPPQLDKRKSMRVQWLSCTQNYCSLIALKLSSTLSPTSQHIGLGICNYVELIDTIFTDVEGVD